MNADIDFAALYRELDVDPAEGMNAFRQAYRRRVAELHPDRRGHPADSPDLQRLNVMYASAIRFHRQYGRLPGTTAPPIANENIQGMRGGIHDDPPSPTRPQRNVRVGYLLTLVVILLAIVLSSRDEDADPVPTNVDEAAPGMSAPLADRTDMSMLDVGAPLHTVLAIQGAPVTADGNRWIYGPSWMRFRCLELVDWYSSPLHPLKTRTSRPLERATRSHRPAHPEDCNKMAFP